MIAPFAKRGGTEQPDYFCGAFHINDGGFERLLRIGHLFRYQRADKRNGFGFTLHFSRDKILNLRFKHFSEGDTPLLDGINYVSLAHRFAGFGQKRRRSYTGGDKKLLARDPTSGKHFWRGSSERFFERLFPGHVSIQCSREHIHRSPGKRDKIRPLFGTCFCSCPDSAVTTKHDKDIKILSGRLYKRPRHFVCRVAPNLRLNDARARKD